MKKALSVLAALILMLAAGCEKQSAKEKVPPPPPLSFTANLTVDFGENSMTALLNQKDSENHSIQILSPEIMTPLTLSYTNGICTVTYDGLTFESDANRFPQAEFGHLLTQALACITQDIDIQKTYSEGIWTYKGTGDRGIFSITRNADSGEWIEFSVEGAGLKVIFSQFISN